MSTAAEPTGATLIGVISDTHGLLRPEAVAALADCAHIVHAGDVGTPAVLEDLRRLAPVVVVRGNNDRGAWAAELPECVSVAIGGVRVHVLHDLNDLAIDPAEAGVRVVISGHSHRPRAEEAGGVLYLNPGAAGPRRFRLPVTLARLRVGPAGVRAEVLSLL